MATALGSKTLAAASKNAVTLYRHSLKSLPQIAKSYQLEYTFSQMKNQIRKDIESHKNVNQIEAIDMLVFRGIKELEETTKIFKTKSHVAKYFAPPHDVSSEKQVPVVASLHTTFDFSIPPHYERAVKEAYPQYWDRFVEDYKKEIPTAEEIAEMQESLEEFFAGYQDH